MPKLGDDIGVVWVATTPRTGSMWTTNIVREIARTEGLEPLPETPLTRDSEIIAYGTRHVAEGRPGVAVLKVHKLVPPMPRSVGVVTRRDVRDALVSYMRFMRLPFENGLRFAANALQRPAGHLYPREPRLMVDYSAITTQPVEVVRSIAQFLGAERAAEACDEIAARFSKDAVKSRIGAADAEVRALAKAGERIERSRLVILSPTNWRVIDPDTQFQTGHVSDYRDGDWRTVLTEEQQAQVNALIEKAGSALV